MRQVNIFCAFLSIFRFCAHFRVSFTYFSRIRVHSFSVFLFIEHGELRVFLCMRLSTQKVDREGRSTLSLVCWVVISLCFRCSRVSEDAEVTRK